MAIRSQDASGRALTEAKWDESWWIIEIGGIDMYRYVILYRICSLWIHDYTSLYSFWWFISKEWMWDNVFLLVIWMKKGHKTSHWWSLKIIRFKVGRAPTFDFKSLSDLNLALSNHETTHPWEDKICCCFHPMGKCNEWFCPCFGCDLSTRTCGRILAGTESCEEDLEVCWATWPTWVADESLIFISWKLTF